MSTPPSSSGHSSGKPIIKPKSSRAARPGGVDGPDPALSFEDALAQIEGILERIESGEVGLEESLAEYERGVGLLNHCRGKLDRAKQKVEDLTRTLSSADESGPGSPSGGPGRQAPDSGEDSSQSRADEEDDDAEPPI